MNKLHEMIGIKTEKAAQYWNANLPGVQVFHGWLKPESMQKIEDEISVRMKAGWCTEKWLEGKLDEWSFAVKEWIDAINKHREDISK